MLGLRVGLILLGSLVRGDSTSYTDENGQFHTAQEGGMRLLYAQIGVLSSIVAAAETDNPA